MRLLKCTQSSCHYLDFYRHRLVKKGPQVTHLFFFSPWGVQPCLIPTESFYQDEPKLCFSYTTYHGVQNADVPKAIILPMQNVHSFIPCRWNGSIRTLDPAPCSVQKSKLKYIWKMGVYLSFECLQCWSALH